MSCNEWQKVKLGEVADILSGYAFKTKDFIDEGIPVVKIKNIIPPNIDINDTQYVSNELYNEKIKFALNYNDVLISLNGSNINQLASAVGKIGRVRLKDKKLLLNQRVGKLYIVDEKRCNYDYLYYYLTQPEVRYNLAAMAGGSANQANISPSQIKDIEIQLPPLEEQEKIANILSSLDDKIELNNEMNKTLEEMAQSIFKRWFVDFEFPNEDGEPYKSSGGEMIDSELGMIPKGWEVKVLGDICDVKGGKRLPKGKIVLDEKTEYPYLRVTDITSGYVNMNSIKYIDEETREKISRYIIEYSDLYISIAGTIGLVGSINKELDGASLTENMARIICNNIEKYYIKLYLNYGEIQHLIKTRAVGSTQPKLPLYVIKDIPVLVPTDKVMNRFKEIIIPVYKSIEENLSNIETIVEIRDSLLPKLMSGEIKV